MPVWDIGSLSNMQMRICVHCTNSFISSKKGVITFYMLIYISYVYILIRGASREKKGEFFNLPLWGNEYKGSQNNPT